MWQKVPTVYAGSSYGHLRLINVPGCNSNKRDKVNFTIYLIYLNISTLVLDQFPLPRNLCRTLFQISLRVFSVRSYKAHEGQWKHVDWNSGYIPSQVLYGKVIDTTCVLWSASLPSSSEAFCQMYRNSKFRHRYHLFAALFSFLALLTSALCAKYSTKHVFHRWTIIWKIFICTI